MPHRTALRRLPVAAAIDCRVIGPNGHSGDCAQLASLLPSQPVSKTRRQRLEAASKMAIRCGNQFVGVAAYTMDDGRLDVLDLGVTASGSCEARDILQLLLQALEAACLAAGGTRVALPSLGAAVAEWAGGAGYGPAGRRQQKIIG